MNSSLSLELSGDPVYRSVELTNFEWLIVSQCVEAFANTYRASQSQIVTTYVTRGQLEQAVQEAKTMNEMIQYLDKIQAKLV